MPYLSLLISVVAGRDRNLGELYMTNGEKTGGVQGRLVIESLSLLISTVITLQ